MHKILSYRFKSEKVHIKQSLLGHTMLFQKKKEKKKYTALPIGEKEAFIAKKQRQTVNSRVTEAVIAKIKTR